MPYNTREKLLAYRATEKFRKRNYEHVKAWRAKPESKAKRAAEARKWREKHPELAKEIQERHRLKDPVAFRIKRSDTVREHHRKIDPEGARRRSLAFKARMRAERESLAGRTRPNTCDICGGNREGIVFDHCHQRGHFRGWLCGRCNKVLGLMEDKPQLLTAMAAYLRRTRINTAPQFTLPGI